MGQEVGMSGSEALTLRTVKAVTLGVCADAEGLRSSPSRML